LHQIDFLQLRNEWATTASKYEKLGGAKMALMFDLAAGHATVPAAAISTLLRGRIASFLLGDADAHWKNHSLMWSGGRWNVSPSYDIVCTMAYPALDREPALMIAGCEDEDRITAQHFRDFHAEALEAHGVRIQAVSQNLSELAERTLARAPQVFDAMAAGIGESAAQFLVDAVMPIVRQRAARAMEIAKELAPKPAVRRRASP
jgi:serine/threonine-protein kinase HipA